MGRTRRLSLTPIRSPLGQSLCGFALAFCAAGAFAGPSVLDPIAERLDSASPADRVTALGELGRLKPSPDRARPLLERLVADVSPEVRSELCWTIKEVLGPAGVDLLERLYPGPEPPVRASAIRAACRLWENTRARVLCRTAFGDPDQFARIEVLSVLRDAYPRDPDAILVFREGLRDGAELVQRAAVFAVQTARDADAAHELGRLARTASDLVAEPAAGDALPTIGTSEAIQELLALLPRPRVEPGKPIRPSDRVRAAAARALERFRDPRALAPLRGLMTDPSPVVRSSAMCALMEMRDRAAAPLITAQLQDRDPRVRQFALRALRRIGDSAAAEEVRRVLRSDQDIGVRATAASTLGDLVGPRAVPDLAAVVNDPDPSVRYEAAAALAGLGKPAAQSLAAFLGDRSPVVQSMAIVGLGQIGCVEAIPAMQRAAASASAGNSQVRIAIADALASIHHLDGLPTLIVLTTDHEPRVRRAAALALGRLGGPKAVRVLQPLVQDADPSVRSAVRRALELASSPR